MKHWWLLVLLVLLIILFLAFDLGRFLSLETLKSGRNGLQQAYQARPLQTMGLYAGIYIVIAALSLPGAAVMTLAGGAIFGIWVGIPLAVISASIGATFALWMARYVFREFVQQRFSACAGRVFRVARHIPLAGTMGSGACEDEVGRKYTCALD